LVAPGGIEPPFTP